MSAQLLPEALLRVIDELGRLPGVGARTAERYAYFLLRADTRTADSLATSIATLHSGVKTCPVTFALIDANQEVSPLYDGRERNKRLIAVVEEPLDIVALERTGQFKGTYHVLGGAISPIDGVGPEQLHIPELLKRIKIDSVEEVIIATNASVEGESTALFIQRQIQEAKLDTKLTRLARGIPVGVDLEYADQITLSHALEGRRVL
ncbi:DNA repair and recombination protein [Candidatus Saccharimonas aalborgensis]|uniref:Recombination protein RecR n=1 Tax=Candidatus Saccharimonas aalborgensis TaxID=1332188 RepID=R4PZE5_9BACT|nr:recombination mediator RecR [Candidatus Saccharimonas aalborgensis]AGL62631.1 DNA repair and recombination protein [Candidatus Saccharimonas aalborgensis]